MLAKIIFYLDENDKILIESAGLYLVWDQQQVVDKTNFNDKT